ncbi:MAG TPA: nucleotide exchange factor GrpE [Rhizomicrobium sp.]|jgi:molecular chaperone GrpE|nr:nucleotide exchange factor GrpE [Rhizomicrobium sp.]
MAENDNDASVETGSAGSGDPQGSDELERLRAEVADLKEKHLRALAEVENTRRRAERDRLDASQYAVTRFARDMLAVSDNLQRALAHLPPQARAEAPVEVKAVLEGVEATERQLAATLERHGVRAINTSDAKFDPHLHQAIAEVPADGRPAGSIVDVVQTGYVIADRLLRPAMVTVARSGDDSAAGTTPVSPTAQRQNG